MLAQHGRRHRRRVRARAHAHDGRIDARRRVEGLGRHVEQVLDLVAPLQHHREPAEGLGARLGGHAVDHFLLQHEHLVDHVRRGGDQVEQDRRRDVVGQVADDADRAAQALGERGEVDLQHVGLDHVEVAAPAQPLGQVAVELDDGQRVAVRAQRDRHRAQARADLDQALARPRRDRPDDAVDDVDARSGSAGRSACGRCAPCGALGQTGGSRYSMKALARRSATHSA